MKELGFSSIVGENYFLNWEKIFLQLGKNMVPASRSIIGRRGMTRNTRRKFFLKKVANMFGRYVL